MKKATVNTSTIIALVVLLNLVWTGAVFAESPDASIEIKQWKAGFIVGVGGGSGTLKFKGKSYPLSIKGLRVGATVGVASADLVGDVFSLKSAKDIEGIYTAAQAAIAVAGGGKIWHLKNQNGVLLKLQGTQIGIELAVDIGGMEVNLK